MMKLFELLCGPFHQFFIGLVNEKYDNNGNIKQEYMKAINDAIPESIQRFIDRILGVVYSPDKYKLGMCYRIWKTEKILYSVFLYRWYSPQQIEPDNIFD